MGNAIPIQIVPEELNAEAIYALPREANATPIRNAAAENAGATNAPLQGANVTPIPNAREAAAGATGVQIVCKPYPDKEGLCEMMITKPLYMFYSRERETRQRNNDFRFFVGRGQSILFHSLYIFRSSPVKNVRPGVLYP